MQSLGRTLSVVPSTYNPNDMSVFPDFLCTEKPDLQKNGSDESLINSISSSEMMLSDNEENVTTNSTSNDADDFFASLDAEFEEKRCQKDPCCRLVHSGYSIYEPSIPNLYADSVDPDQDRINDFMLSSRQVHPLSAAFVNCDACHKDNGRAASTSESGSKRVGDGRRSLWSRERCRKQNISQSRSTRG